MLSDKNATYEDQSLLDLSELEKEYNKKHGYGEIKVKPYDTRRIEDRARLWLALSLVIILAVILLSSFIVVCKDPDKINEVKELLQITLSPIIALVSAATGFYYGTKK